MGIVGALVLRHALKDKEQVPEDPVSQRNISGLVITVVNFKRLFRCFDLSAFPVMQLELIILKGFLFEPDLGQSRVRNTCGKHRATKQIA